jgi:hypothetical protein
MGYFTQGCRDCQVLLQHRREYPPGEQYPKYIEYCPVCEREDTGVLMVYPLYEPEDIPFLRFAIGKDPNAPPIT